MGFAARDKPAFADNSNEAAKPFKALRLRLEGVCLPSQVLRPSDTPPFRAEWGYMAFPAFSLKPQRKIHIH